MHGDHHDDRDDAQHDVISVPALKAAPALRVSVSQKTCGNERDRRARRRATRPPRLGGLVERPDGRRRDSEEIRIAAPEVRQLSAGISDVPRAACSHAQRRAREGHQAALADRVAARLAVAVGALAEPVQRLLGLEQQLTLVGGQATVRHRARARRADVGLVVARAVDAVTQEILQVTGGQVELGAKPHEVFLERRSHLAFSLRSSTASRSLERPGCFSACGDSRPPVGISTHPAGASHPPWRLR